MIIYQIHYRLPGESTGRLFEISRPALLPRDIALLGVGSEFFGYRPSANVISVISFPRES